MSEAYRRKRTFYQDISGNTTIATSDDDQTLVTVRNANHTLFIQRIIVRITTDAAVSWSFEDSNSSAKKIFSVAASPGVNTTFSMDYGEEGVPLTSGKNFLLNVSAAGLAGNITWLGYSKLNNGVAAASV